MKSVDYKLFFAVLMLVIFWMIMISSVSVYWSFRVTNIMANAWRIDQAYNYFYVLRNIWHVFISFVILAIVVKTPYSLFHKYSKYFFMTSIWLLLIVLISGMTLKWARWWISIPGLPFTIQPTEFLKFALIIYLASFFKNFQKVLHTFKDWFIPFSIIIGSVLLLVWLQPDFWTLMVIIPVSIIMFFYAWANIKHLLTILLVGIILSISVYSAWNYDKVTWKNLNKLWYITQRIDNFLADNKQAIKTRTINYQTEQALIAIWSWGFTGLWFGNSVQKFGYLPEVQWDFIFSVIVEELWFLWAFILLSIYIFIWYRWFYIASRVIDPFAKYVAIWISSRILLQAFINIWVNLNIVPLTGITLPFISYWWSSLISLMLWIALLLSISREVNTKPKFSRLSRRKTFMF